MKKKLLLGLISSLLIASMSVHAEPSSQDPDNHYVATPEIDGGIAALSLGMLSGFVAMYVESRKIKVKAN